MNRDSFARARPPARRSRSPSPARRSRSRSPSRRSRSRSPARKMSVGSSSASTARTKKRRVAPVPVHSEPSALAQNDRPSTARTKKRRVAPVSVQSGAGVSSASAHVSTAASSATGSVADTNARAAMVITIQRTLTSQMESLYPVFENALPLNNHGQPKSRTARQVRDNLQYLKTELNRFTRACTTLEDTVKRLESHDAVQQAREDRRLASIKPLQVQKGPHKGKWYCSEADDDLVCRGGPKHGGRCSCAPNKKRYKIQRHIDAQHMPQKNKDPYKSHGDWIA